MIYFFGDMIMSCGFALKSILIGIVMLLPLLIGNPANAVCLQSGFSSPLGGGWLYVGGSEPGNYSSIQDALDNASDGDTVFVYSGIYKPVIIRKALTLLGEDKETTFINGSGDCLVYFSSENVTVDGFTIRHYPIERKKGWGINLVSRNNIRLSNLIVIGCDYGLYHDQTKNIFLNNVTIEKNNYGIELFCPRNITFLNCFLKDNNIALNDKGSSGYPDASVLIEGCNFSNNTCGLNLNELCTEATCPTTVEGNTFYHNEYGLVTFNSQGVKISSNNFNNNSNHVGLYRSSQILLIPFYLKCRQHWSGNYWDTWNSSLPCPLRGTWVLFVWPGLFYQFLRFPFVEFDWQPARSPYPSFQPDFRK